MKILIVSDTHGRDEQFEEAVTRERPFDMLVHCGDVEGREIFIEAYAQCPTYIVAGNCDFFCDLPREQELTIDGKKVLVTHGHYYGASMDVHGLIDEAKARDFQVVMFGHIHKPMAEEKDGILLINPGSLSYPRQEGRKPSYAVLETGEQGFQVNIKYLAR